MIFASLLLNIAVLIPVCAGLLTNANWVSVAYGDETAARNILLAVYGSIMMLSVALLFFQDPKIIATLLVLQIAYKLTTTMTVGVSNPVVVSNVVIAIFHSVTVLIVARAILYKPGIYP